MPKFLNNIDLNGNQLLSPVVHVSSQATAANGPSGSSAGAEGQIFYNSHSSHKKLFYRNNSAWKPIGDILGVTAGTGMTGGGSTGTPVLNVIGGTGITANADDIELTAGLIANGSNITSLGTIGAGVWQSTTPIASAYLDTDTAHLSVAQTFTAQKTYATNTHLNFRGVSSYIYSPATNDIKVVATTITLDAATDIQLEGATTVTGNLSVSGNLNVDGTTTTIDSTTVAIGDSMLKLAKDQAATEDLVDFGFYGQYGVSGTAKWAGLFRDRSVTGDPFTFFDSTQVEPTSTVNINGTGFDYADVKAGKFTSVDGFVGNLAGEVTGNASTATALASAVAINGVDFDGSAAITVTAAAGTLTGGTLNSTVTASSLTSVGTIGTGAWNATPIPSAKLDTDTAHLSVAQAFTGEKTMSTNTHLNFRGVGSYIYSPSTNDLEIVGTDITLDAANVIELEANTNVTGNLAVSGSISSGGFAFAHAKTFVLNDDETANSSANNVSSNNNGAASTIFTITHGMGASRNYKVEVVQVSDYSTVFADVTRPSNSTIVVTFATNVDLDAYLALVTKC